MGETVGAGRHQTKGQRTGFEIFQTKQQVGVLLRDRTAPARIPATVSGAVGLVALIGWIFNVPALVSVLPGAAEMKANTAACVILCSIALWMVAGDAPPGRIRLARVLLGGIDVLRRLKSDQRTQALPVVMLTSSAEEQDIAESYHLGVNSDLVKPVQFPAFVELVAQLGMYWAVMNRLPA